MSARFCPQCGAKAAAAANFCSACGASLTAARRPSWHPTATGGGVFGALVLAGLTIWTVILSPAPARPGPSGPKPGAGKGPTAPATANADAAKAVPLPAEVKKFIADLAAKAKDAPSDVESWSKLAQVNFRAGQLDASHLPEALRAFEHVLELDPKNADALRGIANVHYERNDHTPAIQYFERYLALRPDDPAARTDLGTMYLYAGDPARAVTTYRGVIAKNPSFLQAHYNLAITYHRQGNQTDALAELATARTLATDDEVRKQIDDMVASLQGKPADTAPGRESPEPRSPFQTAVEQAFRNHPIMGPRIVRFDWTGPVAGRTVVQNFPMEGMPPAVREKFAARLGQEIKAAQEAHRVAGPVRMEIADAATGVAMATITP